MTPDAVAALMARAYRHTTPWSAGDIGDLLADPHHVLVSEPNGFLLGRVVADEAEILALATDPDHQRHGVARRCLDAFLREARLRGAQRVYLEVAVTNQPAIAFYKAHGFALAGTRRGYYPGPDTQRVDASVMVLNIASEDA